GARRPHTLSLLDAPPIWRERVALFHAERMADFALGLRFDDLPDAVVLAAVRAVADTLACAVGAIGEPGPAILRRYAIERGGRPDDRKSTRLNSSHVKIS